MCGARFRSENGRVIFDREKCTVCGKCVDVCPNYVNSVCGKLGTVDEIVAEVVKDKMFYENSGGGMTVSGGEPAMQPDGVIALIEAVREKGITSSDACFCSI